jgi:uncharacterized membrane protein
MRLPRSIQEDIETIARHEQEFQAKRSLAERFADRVARFTGTLGFVVLHLAVVVAWVAVNTRHLDVPHFDPFPFPLFDTILALEAILLASFILMRQTNLGRRADEREHLMLQLLLLTEREVSAVVKINQQIADRIGLPISTDKEIQEMAEPTSIDNVAQVIQETMAPE